jgi:poly(3-hydroxybutyrate) depolymerase
MLPTAKGTCPTLATGNSVGISLNGKSMPWTLYVGARSSTATGPIIIYWHGTGTTGSADVGWGIGQAAISAVQSMGGVVAAAESTSSTGTNTGDNVWYTGDVDWADFIIACAIHQLNIDTRHIHVSGYSAGALQSGYMYYARSGYVASVVVYSGGAGIGAGQLQDPSNVAPLIGAHGSTSGDFLAGSTTMFEQAVKSLGAPIVIDCDDGGSHTDITRLTRLAPSTWQFFKDHPFKQGKPDPYAGGLPSGFPTYCKII